MANNTTINTGAGGDIIRDVDRAGVKTPVSLVDIGGLGSEILLSAAAPLPAYLADPTTPAQKAAVGTDGALRVDAQAAGDVISLGGVAYTVKRAFANATASGDTQVVAAVVSKKIRVLWVIVGPVSAAVNVFFKSSVAGAIGSTKYLAANGGYGRTANVYGHFETVAGEALAINLSGAANAGVDVGYIEV